MPRAVPGEVRERPSRPGSVTLCQGDVLEVLRRQPEASFDGLLTDPPYGLGAAPWDRAVPSAEVWRECRRVLRPGSWLLAFGGRRTHHRLMTALEAAGLEIRDVLSWLYGTGMPRGGRTTLRPAWEPVILARRPGPPRPLNVDACRTRGPVLPGDQRTSPRGTKTAWGTQGRHRTGPRHHPEGRWPADLLLGHAPGCTESGCTPTCPAGELDATARGASRFFYCPKPRGREAQGNPHPTRKPLKLTAYLAKLILPSEGGRLLVPYCGSGSEVLGGFEAGWSEVVGVEREGRWLAVARWRVGNLDKIAKEVEKR